MWYKNWICIFLGRYVQNKFDITLIFFFLSICNWYQNCINRFWLLLCVKDVFEKIHDLDFHETLNSEFNIYSLLGFQNLLQVQKILPPEIMMFQEMIVSTQLIPTRVNIPQLEIILPPEIILLLEMILHSEMILCLEIVL